MAMLMTRRGQSPSERSVLPFCASLSSPAPSPAPPPAAPGRQGNRRAQARAGLGVSTPAPFPPLDASLVRSRREPLTFKPRPLKRPAIDTTIAWPGLLFARVMRETGQVIANEFCDSDAEAEAFERLFERLTT